MTGWRLVELGNVADEVTVGHVGAMASLYEERGVPFLRSQNVTPHAIDLSDVKYIGEDFHRRLAKSELRAGDVVTVRTGKPGITAVVPDTLSVANCSDLVITRTGPNLDAKWLSYYMNSAAEGYIAAQLVGAVQQHFNVGAAKKLILQLPPLPEQRAIAQVLGALDDKIAANTRMTDSASRLAGLVFDRATVSGAVRRMSDVLTPILGGTPSRANSDFWQGSNLWASARDVTGAKAGVILDSEEKISDLAVASTKAKPLPTGSVILTARGTVGAVARLARPSSFNQSCYGFAPGTLPPGVLYFSILRATERAKAFAHGSVFDTITMRTFDHLSLPDLDEAGASALEQLVAPLLDTVTSAVMENRILAATRDTLLPQLMSGKLRVRDAEKTLEGVL